MYGGGGGVTGSGGVTIDSGMGGAGGSIDSGMGGAGGSIDGNSFILIANTRVTLAASGTGTFSGTDDNGNGTVTGTFTCG